MWTWVWPAHADEPLRLTQDIVASSAGESRDAQDIPSFACTTTLRYDGINYATLRLVRSGAENTTVAGCVTLRRPERPHYSVPLLKSNLQKAVRRQALGAALASVAALLYQDPKELLRRLPIIAVEDVCLLPHFDRVVWLMVAHSKGYTLQPSDIGLLFYFTHCLVHHETVCAQQGDRDVADYSTLMTSVSSSGPQSSSMRMALLVRMSYGGMAGDMSLLAQVASNCCEHQHCLAHDSVPIPNPDVYQHYADHSMTLDDQLPTSVDFHCTNILKPLVTMVPVSEEVLRQTIWLRRSSTNARRPQLVPRAPEWWQRVDEYMERNWKKYWKPVEPAQAVEVKKRKGYVGRSTGTKQPPLVFKAHRVIEA